MAQIEHFMAPNSELEPEQPNSVKIASPDTFMDLIGNREATLRIHDRYIGTATRRDAWSCHQRRVDAHWLLLTLDGQCRLETQGGAKVLGPGEMVWLPHGARHCMRWSPIFHFAECYFSLEHNGAAWSPASQLIRAEAAWELHDSINRLADEAQLPGICHRARVCSLLAVLLIDGLRLAQLHTINGAGLTRRQQIQVLRYTREHIAESPTPGDLAAAVGLSAGYFSRLFKLTFGIPAREWLNRERIMAAARLLKQTDLTVYQIAEQIGYAEAAQFSRQFRRVTGISPQAYRARR